MNVLTPYLDPLLQTLNPLLQTVTPLIQLFLPYIPYVSKGIAGFLCASLVIFPVGALLQENKAFPDTKLGVVGSFRAILFVQIWMLSSGFSALYLTPFLLLRISVEKFANTISEYFFAVTLCSFIIGDPKVVGLENLDNTLCKDKDGKQIPLIIVANHGSMLDAALLYHLKRKFVWIAKASVTLLPGVGQIMYISGHILLNRTGKGSIKEMYIKSNAKLAQGTDIFIFPQGTRDRLRVLPFKHGAFSIALGFVDEATGVKGCNVLPVSIELNSKAWRVCGSEKIATITVHPVIEVSKYLTMKDDEGKMKLMADAMDAVYSVGELKRLKEEKGVVKIEPRKVEGEEKGEKRGRKKTE